MIKSYQILSKVIYNNLKTIVIITLLLFYFLIRVFIYHNENIQNTKSVWYSFNYTPAVYYASGYGFSIPKNNISQDVKDFINLKSNSVDKSLLQDNINTNNIELISKIPSLAPFSGICAGILWKIFGISWDVLFYFNFFLGTLACFCLYLLIYKFTSSFFAASIATFAYSISALDLFASVFNMRNTSPVWFLAFTLLFLFLFTSKSNNKLQNYFSCFILGIITMLGIGWRADILLFVPFILVVLIILLKNYKNTNKQIGSIWISIVLFIIGISSTYSVYKIMVPYGNLSVFHIAYYAEDRRSKITNYENNFQIPMSDTMTAIHVNSYHSIKHPEEPKPIYLGEEYGKNSFILYTEELKHNIYRWVASYPEYLVYYAKHIVNGYWVKYKLIKVIGGIVFLITFLGIILLLILNIYRFQILVILSFIFYYSLVYWAMLPLSKHIITLSVPVYILFGLVLSFIYKIKRNENYKKQILINLKNKQNYNFIGKLLFYLGLVYLILLFTSKLYSSHIYKQYINAIDQLKQEKLYEKGYKKIDNTITIENIEPNELFGVIIEFELLNNTEDKLAYIQYIDKSIYPKQLSTNNIAPNEYRYLIKKENISYTLFSTVLGLNWQNNSAKKIENYTVNIILPKRSNITKLKLVPLNDWKGVSYATIYNKNSLNTGSKSLGKVLPSINKIENMQKVYDE